MSYTGKDKQILGRWADEGYFVREYDDHVVTVGYKDKEVAAFSQTGVTSNDLQRVCERHHSQLAALAGVAQ
jgi:hypothetical protein